MTEIIHMISIPAILLSAEETDGKPIVRAEFQNPSVRLIQSLSSPSRSVADFPSINASTPAVISV